MPFLIVDNNIFSISIMNPRIVTRLTKLIALTLFLLILMPAITITSADVSELNVPQEVIQGNEASISGRASPNEKVWLKSLFEISLPVSDGKYSCDFTDIHFPAGEKTFSVTAENVNNIRASLSPVFWQTIEYPLSGPENATASIATLSISFPATMHGAKIDISGRKNVKVYGDAADKATSVNLSVAMSIKVNADSNGDFVLNISTEGVPPGVFLINAGGINKNVYLVLPTGPIEPTSTPGLTIAPSPSPSPSLSPSPSPAPEEPLKTTILILSVLVIIAVIMGSYFAMRLRRRK